MRPSATLEQHRDQVRQILDRFGFENPRLFGSVARNEDTEASDLDIVVAVPEATSLFDLAKAEIELEAILRCKVELVTDALLAPDVAARASIDMIPMQ